MTQALGPVLPTRVWQADAPSGFKATVGTTSVLVDGAEVRFANFGDSPRDPPAAVFTLTELGRAGAPAMPTPNPTLQGNAVVIDRGIAQEYIELGPSSLTRRFVFASMPDGTGPLTMRIKVEGSALSSYQLAYESMARFELGDKELEITASHIPTDPAQRRSTGVAYHRGEIVVTFPEVDVAPFPLTLSVSTLPTLRVGVTRRAAGGWTGSFSPPALSCSAEQCVAGWRNNLDFDAVRLQPNGTLLGQDQLRIGLIGSELGLSASVGNEHFAVRSDLHTLEGSFIDTTTGSISDYPGFLINQSDHYDAILDGMSTSGVMHLVVYRSGGKRYARRVPAGAAEPLGAAIALGDAADDAGFALGAGVDQFAIASKNKLQRVDAATGVVLDAEPITFSDLGYGLFASRPSIAFDGANYVLSWIDSGRLLAARVRASDGVLLDPDSTSTVGARQLCQVGNPTALQVSIDGGTLYATWSSSGVTTATSFALSPWTSSTAACSSGVVVDAQTDPVSVAFAGSHGIALVADRQRVRLITFDVPSPGTVTIGADTTANYTERDLSPQVVRSNGRDFLVVLSSRGDDDVFPSLPHTYPIFARIDGVTGASLGQLEDPLAPSWSVEVASNGSDYLLGYPSAVRKLTCDGRLGSSRQFSASQPLQELVSDGQRYLGLCWQPSVPTTIQGVRFDAAGNQLGNALELGNWHGAPKVATTQASSGQRLVTLLGDFTDNTDPNPLLQLLNVNVDTGSMASIVLLNDAEPSEWTLDSDGRNLFVLGPNVTGRVGTLLEPETGSTVEGATVLDLPQDGSTPVFDGVSHIFPGTSLYRVSAELELHDGAVTVPHEVGSWFAPNGRGRSLVLYISGHSGNEVRGYFIDNEYASEDPNTFTAACEPSAGGAGGAAVGGEGGEPGSENGGAVGSENGGTAGSQSAGTAGTGAGGVSGVGAGGIGSAGDPNPMGEGAAHEGGAANEPGGGGGGDDGCSCAVPGGASGSNAPWHVLLGLALIIRRWRRDDGPKPQAHRST
jgi:hypothetical protein